MVWFNRTFGKQGLEIALFKWFHTLIFNEFFSAFIETDILDRINRCTFIGPSDSNRSKDILHIDKSLGFVWLRVKPCFSKRGTFFQIKNISI